MLKCGGTNVWVCRYSNGAFLLMSIVAKIIEDLL